MEEPDIQNALDSYAKSLSHLYRSIICEKEDFTSLLGSQWYEISSEEQETLIDDHFTPPNVLRKYPQRTNEYNSILYPHYVIQSGQRIVEDDEGDMWQDEHSGPFSWETGSQSELTFSEEQPESRVKALKDPKRPKSPKLIRASSSSDIMNSSLDGQTSNFQTLHSLWEAHHLPTGEFYMAARVPSGARSDGEAAALEDTPEMIKTDFRSDLKPVTFEAVQPEPTEPTPLQQVTLRRVDLTEKITPEVELKITEPGDTDEPGDSVNVAEPQSTICLNSQIIPVSSQINHSTSQSSPSTECPSASRDAEPNDSTNPKTTVSSSANRTNANVQLTPTNDGEEATASTTEPEVDILTKFGVTFSIAPEKKPTASIDNPTFHDGEMKSKGDVDAEQTDQFDFLTDW